MKSILIFLISFFVCGQLLAIAPIAGDSTVCMGLTTVATDATPGGTWSSSIPSVATIGSSTGIVTGVSAGTVVLTYTVGASYVIRSFSVNPLYPISGPGFLCSLFSILLTNPAPFGVWSSSNPLSAEITYSFGTIIDTAAITGLAPGIDTITYTLSTGCAARKVITVSPSPVPIIGSNHVCVGTTGALTDAVAGGVWSSSAPAVASIGTASGIDAGITLGVSNITYTIGPGCFAVLPLTVNPVPGPIMGPSTVCALDSILLTNTEAGGVWSSSNTAIATAGPTYGNVTGVSGGVATISYYFDPTCYVTHLVTVNPTPSLSGSLTPPAICSGTLFSYMPTSTLPGTTFTWTRAMVAGISNPAGSGIGNPMEILVNTSTIPLVVTYSYFLSTGVCFNTQLVTVIVNPVPQLTSSLTPPAICDSTIFNYTPMSGTPGTFFTWSRAVISGILEDSASGAGNPNEQLIDTTALPVGVSYVFVLNAGGCTNTHTVLVTVNPTPMLTSALLLPAQCDTIPVIYIPTSATPAFNYAWNRPSLMDIIPPSSTGMSSILDYITNMSTIPINVTYQIRLGVGGCTNSFYEDVVVPIVPCSAHLGTAAILTTRSIDISPNPTTGEIKITGLYGATSLEVFNLLGQKIFSNYFPLNIEETIDISGQPSGVYFIVVKGADGIITSKILKQ